MRCEVIVKTLEFNSRVLPYEETLGNLSLHISGIPEMRIIVVPVFISIL
jgi:hypothetical protein